jgi:hypothetical protein
MTKTCRRSDGPTALVAAGPSLVPPYMPDGSS